MKKLLATLLTATLLTTAFTGCGQSTPESESSSSSQASVPETSVSEASSEESEAVTEEIVTIKYCVPGSKPVDYDMVIAEVNKKMGKDIGVNIEIEYIPWDAWDQKINMKLTTGEEFDLLQIMQTHGKLIANNALTDITSLLDEYGTAYKEVVPQNVLDAAKVNGKLYVMPTYWYEPTAECSLLIRTDIRDKYGFSNPKDPYEALDQLETVMQDWEGTYKPYIIIDGKNISPTGGSRSIVLHPSYDTYPFIVKDELAIIYEDMTMGGWIESEEFKKDAMFYHEAYTRGLISPDVLTIQPTQKAAHVSSGEWYLGFGGGSFDTTNMPNAEDIFESITFAKEGTQLMRPMTIKDTIGVPYTSKHPEAAVKFINWLYTDQENYNLFLYGIEGEHYTNIDERHHKLILNPDTNTVDWSFPDWMIGNLNFVKVDPDAVLECVEKERYQVDEDALIHPADAFVFDGTPVQAELANVQSAIQTYIIPIYVGVVSYEEEFDNAMKELKAAGYDTVMAEYEKQYNAFCEGL